MFCPVAAADSYDYNLARQPLATALTHYAEASNLQILFPSQGVPDIQAGPVQGHYTPEQALNLLLQNTQLHYTFGGNHAVVIHQQTLADMNTPTTKTDAAITTKIAPPPTASATETLAPDEIFVTGIRSSIWRNLSFKHQANATLDVMTSEEVGKFPDKNAADSLQRIPGVSVDRIWGEARDINIRGTDKDINRTLMNGQNVASAYWWANDNPSRGFNYTILASELISSLAVYKSPEADIDEGSVGGTVIIYTHKPFDMENGTLRATIEEQYADLANAFDPQVSLLGSWKNSEQTFGILASLNWQNRTMRRDGLEAFPDNTLYNIVDDQGHSTANVYTIWGGGSAIFQQQRKRLTNNITLQWVPSDGWQAVFNYVDSATAMSNSNQNFLFMPGGIKLQETPPATVSNPRFGATGDGRQTLLGGTMNNADSVGAALDAIFRQSYVDSAVYDLDVQYQNHGWLLHTQAGVTTASGGSNHDRLYRFVGNTRERFSLSRDSIEVEYLDLNPEDATGLSNFSSDSHDWIRKMGDHENYAQIDSQWDIADNIFSSLKSGFKWRDQTITNNRTVGSINTDNLLWPQLEMMSLAQVSSGLTPQLHEKTATANSLTRFAWADKNLIDTEITPLLDNGLMTYRYDKEAFYHINEVISAGYLKANFNSTQWRGNIGVRAAHTQQTSSAYQNQILTINQRNYSDYLPNLNLAFDASENLVWRASLSKVMARPTFQNLSANIVIDGTSSTASGGNPELQPFRANQADFGAEWYFDKAAILSATYFYKTISTFIYTQTAIENVNGKALNVTRPYNAKGADIAGLELQWQQDLSNGFGWLSNYTYTHAVVPSPDEQRILKLPGNSRDQINASIYYENKFYNLRLSYNYRSKSYGELISGSQDETNAYQQWDFTASRKIKDSITLYVEGINLTNEVIFYRTANNIPQGLYEHGRRFAAGTRLSF